ncbi:hypothetical protein CS542_00465 [Pedobacter sp. IW39]|nr:hypothetical protein CS542_00465 [Pedobacter sp. IW39]
MSTTAQQLKISIEGLTMMAQGNVSADQGQHFNLIVYWSDLLYRCTVFLASLLSTVRSTKTPERNSTGMAFSFLNKSDRPCTSGLNTIQNMKKFIFASSIASMSYCSNL